MKINGKSPRTFEQCTSSMHKKRKRNVPSSGINISGAHRPSIDNFGVNPAPFNILGANPPLIDQEKQHLVRKISQQEQEISYLNRSLYSYQQEVKQLRNRIQNLEANNRSLKDINKMLVNASEQPLLPPVPLPLEFRQPQRKRQKTEFIEQECVAMDLNSLLFGYPNK